ncbi:MAG: NADH-quinone oxidoreductase subunit NuoK [Cytophagales bacterium]|nr:NADH-quinone oxidoreductase subunit NuoK [Bernardetiaceae bacterium]MDW8211849.1 NADH-quinone oxidoreductase subunit NuoK [Cytophagales bacterium]
MVEPLHYWILSAVLFSIGVAVAISKRNAIGILMGLELMLNAANLNIVAGFQQSPYSTEGQLAGLFVIAIAAAESALALAIAYQVYKQFKTVSMDKIASLKE